MSHQFRVPLTKEPLTSEPYIRPQENQFLSVPATIAQSLPPNIQSLLVRIVMPIWEFGKGVTDLCNCRYVLCQFGKGGELMCDVAGIQCASTLYRPFQRLASSQSLGKALIQTRDSKYKHRIRSSFLSIACIASGKLRSRPHPRADILPKSR